MLAFEGHHAHHDLSSRELNQDSSRAKKTAEHGPVFITDGSKPTHVLLCIEEYPRITGGHQKIADLWRWRGSKTLNSRFRNYSISLGWLMPQRIRVQMIRQLGEGGKPS